MRSRPRIDATTFEAWVRAHHVAVYASALRITRNEVDARDVTQQVFLSVLEGRIDLAGASDPGRVLRWWAVRDALSRLRGARNARRREMEYAMERPRDHEEHSVESEDERARLQELVDGLPEELRLAVELRFREELTFAEIGTALSVSEAAAHGRVQRALEQLRGALERVGMASLAANLERSLPASPSIAAPSGLSTTLLALHAPVATAGLQSAPVWFLAGAVSLVLVGALAFEFKLLRSPASDPDGIPLALPPPRAEEPQPLAPAGELGAARSPLPAGGSTEPSETAEKAWIEASGSAERGNGTAVVRGRVLDAQGFAVADALVRTGPTGKGDPRLLVGDAGVRTGADGRYRLEVRATGEREPLRVLVDAAELVEIDTPVIVVTDGATLDVDPIMLVPATDDPVGQFTLAVRVVDESGKPAAGIPVRLFRSARNRYDRIANEWEAGGTTDAFGLVDLAGGHLGAKTLIVDARERGWRFVRRRVVVDAAGPRRLELGLERGLDLAGTVRGVDGSPLADVSLAIGYAADPGSAGMQLVTDALGRFRFSGLDPVECVLDVRGDGLSPARVPASPGTRPLEVQLKHQDDARDVGDHMAELHGRLVDARTRAPLAVSWSGVRAERIESETRELFLRDEAESFLFERPYQTAGSLNDADAPAERAEFHEVGLEPGRYVLVVRAADHAVSFGGPFVLGARTIASDLEIAVDPPIELSGVVRGPDGVPLAGARVAVLGAHAASPESVDELDRIALGEDVFSRVYTELLVCDADGRFRIQAAPGIDVVLVALHAGCLPTVSPVVRVTGSRADLVLLCTRRR